MTKEIHADTLEKMLVISDKLKPKIVLKNHTYTHTHTLSFFIAVVKTHLKTAIFCLGVDVRFFTGSPKLVFQYAPPSKIRGGPEGSLPALGGLS